MKIWFDLANSPHISQLAHLIRDRELDGYGVSITCRALLARVVEAIRLTKPHDPAHAQSFPGGSSMGPERLDLVGAVSGQAVQAGRDRVRRVSASRAIFSNDQDAVAHAACNWERRL